MAKDKDLATSPVKTKKEKRIDIIVFVLLSIGAVAMVFPLVYMVCASFMTKGQILSGELLVDSHHPLLHFLSAS